MSFLDLIFSSAFDVHDLSLPLTPSRWEGGPLSGIFLLVEKNTNNCIIYNYFVLAHREENTAERSPLPAGGG